MQVAYRFISITLRRELKMVPGCSRGFHVGSTCSPDELRPVRPKKPPWLGATTVCLAGMRLRMRLAMRWRLNEIEHPYKLHDGIGHDGIGKKLGSTLVLEFGLNGTTCKPCSIFSVFKLSQTPLAQLWVLSPPTSCLLGLVCLSLVLLELDASHWWAGASKAQQSQ